MAAESVYVDTSVLGGEHLLRARDLLAFSRFRRPAGC